MRYAAHLRTSKRRNILQSHIKSGLIAVTGFLIAGGLLLWLARGTQLSLNEFLVGFGYSLGRTTAAYAIAFVLALTLALAITKNQLVENLFLPILDVLQSFPSFALFPVLVAALAHYPEAVIATPQVGVIIKFNII